MAKISLRSYLKEIDSLIDRGENSEAIAHCKYLLKIYSKYIPVYTLLGKAYLESQKYSEALDIFQRVLSVYPDDFISHLSLSIIREGEDNLDAAIFHMERAYEVQPANPGIQNELRRLYGRRDGAIPPRVRLTRGALVRMYERGELYRQAIAEIRAAITEDPDRIDLKVILCRMYYLSGQKVEAADIAGQLLSKLPFCFEANRILADILPGTSRAEDAEPYKKHVLDLDPFYAFTPLSSPNTAHVPDNSILIDQLDVRSAGPFTDTNWAQNLGISLPGPSHEEELPDWFQTSQPPQEEQKSEPVQELPSEDAIPDFIREAGFTPASGPEEPSTLELPEEVRDETGEIAAAEIPDWLQSIAPVESGDESPTSGADESWFSGLLQPDKQSMDESENQVPTVPGEPIERIDETTGQDNLPEWMRSDETETATSKEQGGEELPAWLSQPPVMPDRNELPEDEQSSSELPDWLNEPGETKSEETPVESQEIKSPQESEVPAWLQDLSQPEITADSAPLPAEQPQVEEIEELPDWISGTISQPLEQLESESTAGLSDVSAEGIPEEASSQGSLVEEPFAELAEPSQTTVESTPVPQDQVPASNDLPLPDWLAGLDQEQPLEKDSGGQVEQATEPVELESESLTTSELLPGLSGEQVTGEESEIHSGETETDEPQTEFTEDETVFEIPENLGEPLRSSGEEDAQAPTQPVKTRQTPSQPEISQEISSSVNEGPEEPEILEESSTPGVAETIEQPLEVHSESDTFEEEVDQVNHLTDVDRPLEQLNEITSELPQKSGPDSDATSQTEEIESASPLDEMPADLDAALAWMEALAARQGAVEGTLSSEAEDQSTEMPDWLKKEVENAPENPPLLVSASDEAEDHLQEFPPSTEEISPREFIEEIIPETSQLLEPETLISEAETSIQDKVESQDKEAPPAEVSPENEPSKWLEAQEEDIPSDGIVGTAEEFSEGWVREELISAEELPSASEQISEPTETVSPVEQTQPPSDLESMDESETIQVIEESFSEEPMLSPLVDSEVTPEKILELGQAALRHNELHIARESYATLIQSGRFLEETIHDLREAIDRYPMETSLYQLLGDAYLSSNQLQEAIDTYTKAEQLLR